MSSAYAVAAVTAVLRSRVRARLQAAGVNAVTGTVEVSALAPDRIAVGDGEPSRLNLFLHNVGVNVGWRNVGQPERDPRGARLSAPPLGLDLHYLLTAYGADAYHAEILLGHASQELHENAVLTRTQIRDVLAPAIPDPNLPQAVADSRLADQVEGLRIVPVTVPPEEMSRMWTALQANYRPTIAFQVGVVLIDNVAVAAPSLPVLVRGPEIDTIQDAGDPAASVLASSTIAIRGRRLSAPGVQVRIGDVAAAPGSVSDTELTLDLTTLPEPPRAGLVGVEVVHTLALGQPPVPHEALTSEPAALRLRPAATFSRTIASTTTVDGVTIRSGTITATVDPPIHRDQRVAILLNERGAPATRAARTYAFTAPDGNGLEVGDPPSTSVAVAFTGVAEGRYVTRISVDGVDSLLERGADGRFSGPQVVLT
jgi:stage V sporulation protein SpoVS